VHLYAAAATDDAIVALALPEPANAVTVTAGFFALMGCAHAARRSTR
jgi:hypothetical protein